MKVLLLSRYGSLGASSRVRYMQYLEDFEAQGWSVEISPLFCDAYLKALYGRRNRIALAVRGYFGRLYSLLRAKRFDVLIIEKELLPFMPALAERLLSGCSIPYVVDYDDALFHRYDLHSHGLVRRFLGRKIDVVMSNAAVVITGNDYLAERARKAGAIRIEIVPTVVDTDRYQAVRIRGEGPPVVGWIGTPQTSRYLQPLLPVFEALQREMPVRFVAVGAREADFAGTQVEVWPWAEVTEVSSIQMFDIGIMPLDDTPWERGKCGYKLIQYMACNVPVVASPIGENRRIVKHGKNGLLAETLEDWQRALRCLLISDVSVRQTMGAEGRQGVEAWYSRRVQAPRLIKCVQEAAS